MSQEPATSPAATPAAKSSLSVTRLATAVIPVLLIGAGVYAVYTSQNPKPDSDLPLRQTGLASPTNNTINARFTDANGDLVADTPAETISPDTIVFSYIASDKSAEEAANFKEFVDALATATGKTVTFDTSLTTQVDQLQAFRDGRLHVTGLSTGQVPIAVFQAGFVPVANLAKEDGTNYLKMKVIVPASKSFKSLTDLKGEYLTVTEPTSNSGYRAPLVIMRDAGMTLGKDYDIRFSYGHFNSIAGIKDGSFVAAAVAGDLLDREVAAGNIAKDAFRVIFESDKFPTATLGYAYNLDPELAGQIRDTILNFKFAGTGLEKQFGGSGQTKFVPVDFKKDWELVRRVDNSIGVSYEKEIARKPTVVDEELEVVQPAEDELQGTEATPAEEPAQQ